MSDQKAAPTEQEQLSAQQKALAGKWGKRLERALKDQTASKQEEKFKRLRKYVRGDVGDDGQGGLVRTNIVHSNFAAILPQIYTKNPEISVTPTEAAGDGAYAWVVPFCKTLQAVLNRTFIKDGKLKPRAKAAIRAAMTTAIGWAKVSWQKDIRKDPIIENRINDTQDNLQRIRRLIEEIEEGDESRCELEAKQGELEQQLAALQQQAEVTTASGIVIDRVLTEDIFILDDTLYDFDGYEQADAIAHRVWMTTERYEEMFGKAPPKTAMRYGQDKREKGAQSGGDNKVELVAVFETWSKLDNTVYTLCAGADEWAREPYVPPVLGKRFYGFFGLAFNPVDGRVEPLSDAELLIELQDEYNTTRTNFAEHRRENLPVRVHRKSGGLSDADINALANRRAGQWIGIEGDPTVPIQNDIAILPNPPVDPGTYDVQPILRDAEMVLGAGDAAKGVINKAKTATEAEIMAQGLQSRVGERQDVVEDWIAEMARYAAELCLQELTEQEVKRIAGPDAVWPKMNREQVFDLVSIEIRAGSTGRPNQAKEREQWAQMLPQIKESIAQVAELRAKGQHDMAETVMKLLEETLRRFDERIDIESFLPPRQEGQGQPPAIPPELQQQVEQMQSMLQQLQQQNQQLQTQLADKQAEQQADAERAQIQAQASIEEARIKADAQAMVAIETAKIKAESDQKIAMCREMMVQMAAQKQEQMSQMMAHMHEAMCAMAKHIGAAMEPAEVDAAVVEPGGHEGMMG